MQLPCRHIKNLNTGYINGQRSAKVQYVNAFASFVDPHTIELKDNHGRVERRTGRRFVIAVGGRPKFPSEEECPGAKEVGISSDDVFSLENSPGKTLIVGASYISLETAGFLRGLGLNVTVMMCSIPLRGFDQDMANRVVEHMKSHGVKFLERFVPCRVRFTLVMLQLFCLCWLV